MAFLQAAFLTPRIPSDNLHHREKSLSVKTNMNGDAIDSFLIHSYQLPYLASPIMIEKISSAIDGDKSESMFIDKSGSKALSANKCNEFLGFPAIRACKKTTRRSGYFLTGSKHIRRMVRHLDS